MSVVEAEQEAFPLRQKELKERLLVPDLLNDPSEVHLPRKLPFTVLLDLLQIQVDTSEAELEELGASGVNIVSVALTRNDLLYKFF